MSATQTRRWHAGWSCLVAGAAALLLWGSGCEMASYMDQSVWGRHDPTPAILPILASLDVIDEPPSRPVGLSQVTADDLQPLAEEYVLGAGDAVAVTIFELLAEGRAESESRRIDDLGNVRLPVVGAMRLEGLTASEAEAAIAQQLVKIGHFRKPPTVTVLVLEGRRSVFTIIGEPQTGATRIGQYMIQGKNFRLLDAIALAGGINGQIKTIYVMRQVSLTGERRRPSTEAPGSTTAPETPADLLRGLMEGLDGAPPAPGTQPAPALPAGAAAAAPAPGAEAGLDAAAVPWVNVDGKWVSAQANPAAAATQPADLVAQRMIEVPYDKLLDGDARYNLVVRPGDIIRVPPPVIGNVYVMGQIQRPGTYQLPGDRDLTLKNLVAAAGGPTVLAVPDRVDLIRRVGRDQEAMVRLDLRAIFQGTQPDIFLKPNDQVVFGTNPLAYLLGVVRNGFRVSYGFGFILDRNFGPDVFGNQ